MDIVDFARVHEVGGAYDAAGRDYVGSLVLRFSEQRSGVACRIAVIPAGYLHHVERQFAKPPLGAPVGNHVGEPGVIAVVHADVGLALVPDEAAYGIPCKRVEHGVVHGVEALIVGHYVVVALGFAVPCFVAFEPFAA